MLSLNQIWLIHIITRALLYRESTVVYAFIAGFLLSLLIAIFIYSRYKDKRQYNPVDKEEQENIIAQQGIIDNLQAEKEWLLREIHHRVKNNLQIVISLLNTQSAYLHNEDALLAIRKSQNRVYALSLIHQKLYQSENLAEIDMNWYINELIGYMRECFGTEKKIRFLLETEAIRLDVAQAVPLGLIINEAITNASKYAFPGDRVGKVRVSLKMIADNRCELRIADDGAGLSLDFDLDDRTSFGMSLMIGLSDQLDGQFRMWNEEGLTIEVSFLRHYQLLGYKVI